VHVLVISVLVWYSALTWNTLNFREPLFSVSLMFLITVLSYCVLNILNISLKAALNSLDYVASVIEEYGELAG
jgi:hypothetical protein